jgi:hypothetical protein
VPWGKFHADRSRWEISYNPFPGGSKPGATARFAFGFSGL